jgi:hypothetical protein
VHESQDGSVLGWDASTPYLLCYNVHGLAHGECPTFRPPPLESPRLGRWTGGRQPPQQEGHTLAALHSSPCPVDLLGAMTTSRKLVVSSRAAIKLLPNEDAPCRGCSNSRATTKRGCTMSPGRARAPPSLRASSDAHQLWKVQAHGTCHFFGWLVLDLL